MGDVAAGAELVADAVAEPERDVGEATDRHPGRHHALPARRLVARIPPGLAQIARQHGEGAVGEGVGEGLAGGRAQRLDAVVDGAHPGAEPEPRRRLQGEVRVQEHGLRREPPVDREVLDLARLVGDADEIGELPRRERRRDGEQRDGVGTEGRHFHLVRVGELDHAGVEAGRFVDPFGEADGRRLGRVVRRAAAEADQRVGAFLAGEGGGGDDAPTGDVLHRLGEHAGTAPAGRGHHLVQQGALPRQRMAGDDHRPAHAVLLEFGGKLREAAAAEMDLVHRQHGEMPPQFLLGQGEHRLASPIRPRRRRASEGTPVRNPSQIRAGRAAGREGRSGCEFLHKAQGSMRLRA